MEATENADLEVKPMAIRPQYDDCIMKECLPGWDCSRQCRYELGKECAK